MSLFVQDVFAEAKTLGLTNGFVGTYADLKEAVADYWSDEFAHEGARQAELAYERHLEDRGWADKFWEQDAMLTGALGYLPPLDLAFPELVPA